MNRVAVAQMTSSASVAQNLDQLIQIFKQAAEQEVKLLLLPENFAFMGLHENDKLTIAEVEGDGRIQSCVSHLASYYGVWVIAGTIPLKANDGRVFASCLVFDALGKTVARYDKIHLFDVTIPGGEFHQESRTIHPGENIIVVDTPVGRVGLSVCYDLRFPELYRQLVLQRAEILAVPSAFTAMTGAAHWEPLLRARAIENLSYVLASNQAGTHENGRETYGHSMIVDPWGKICAEAKTNTSLVMAEIELSYLLKLRQHFPCNQHHKMA